MKLSKFAAIVKRTKVCTLLHVDGSGIWLATRGAVYKATELPEIHGGEQLCTVLDIDPTAARSIHTDETHFTGADNIYGVDLADTADELEAAAYAASLQGQSFQRPAVQQRRVGFLRRRFARAAVQYH